MNPVYIGLFMAIIGAFVAIGSSIQRKRWAGSEKYQKILSDFTEEANAMLEEGETVNAVCGYYPCAAVTGSRLLISSKKGIISVPYSHIRSVRGMDSAARNTMDPSRIFVLEIRADKKYSIPNSSDGFEDVVRTIFAHLGI